MATGTPEDDERGVARLAADIAVDAAALVRAEIELAKAEATQAAVSKGMGVGLLAAAAFIGLGVLLALMAALVLGLATWLTPWLAALVAAGVLLLVSILVALMGMLALKRRPVPSPAAVAKRVRQDLTWPARQPTSSETSRS